MLKQLLRKLGYIHESELTEDFLCYEIAKIIGDPREYSIEKKQEDLIFADLGRIEGIAMFLNATMAKDMQRDFASTPDQRQLIRGAFARTAYLKSKLVKKNDEISEGRSVLKSRRHG